MSRPLDRRIARLIEARKRTTTIALHPNGVYVSGNNATFPRLSEIGAARMLHPPLVSAGSASSEVK